jgi:hypothetical protein
MNTCKFLVLFSFSVLPNPSIVTICFMPNQKHKIWTSRQLFETKCVNKTNEIKNVYVSNRGIIIISNYVVWSFLD